MYVCREFELKLILDDATAIAIGADYIPDGEKLSFLDFNVLKPPDGTCFTADELKAFFKKLAGKPASHAHGLSHACCLYLSHTIAVAHTRCFSAWPGTAQLAPAQLQPLYSHPAQEPHSSAAWRTGSWSHWSPLS